MSLVQEVTPGLWRGPQPTVELWSELQDLGVTKVIKLNYDYEGSDADAAKYGMSVQSFAMPPSRAGDVLDTPTDVLVLAAVSAVSDSEDDTYVHCLHGHDRTGLIVGLYRLRCGWAARQAYEEMCEMGFHRVLHGLMESWERLSK